MPYRGAAVAIEDSKAALNEVSHVRERVDALYKEIALLKSSRIDGISANNSSGVLKSDASDMLKKYEADLANGYISVVEFEEAKRKLLQK